MKKNENKTSNSIIYALLIIGFFILVAIFLFNMETRKNRESILEVNESLIIQGEITSLDYQRIDDRMDNFVTDFYTGFLILKYKAFEVEVNDSCSYVPDWRVNTYEPQTVYIDILSPPYYEYYVDDPGFTKSQIVVNDDLTECVRTNLGWLEV